MNFLSRTVLAVVAAASLAGCASVTPLVQEPEEAATVDEDTKLHSRFAPGRGLLDGFDPVVEGARWRPGDRVLLGVAVDGLGPPREWYLHLTVLGDDSTGRPRDEATFATGLRGQERREVTAEFGLIPLRVQFLDDQLRMVSDSTALMPEIGLRYGLFEHIEQERAGESAMDPVNNGPIVDGRIMASEMQVRGMAGMLTMRRFPQFLARLPSVSALVRSLLRPPSLGSVIINRGVKTAVGLGSDESVACVGAWWPSAPALWSPAWVDLNGQPAITCEILVARASPPLAPCSGMLALDAYNPDHPERRVRVRLLAARRGIAR